MQSSLDHLQLPPLVLSSGHPRLPSFQSLFGEHTLSETVIVVDRPVVQESAAGDSKKARKPVCAKSKKARKPVCAKSKKAKIPVCAESKKARNRVRAKGKNKRNPVTASTEMIEQFVDGFYEKRKDPVTVEMVKDNFRNFCREVLQEKRKKHSSSKMTAKDLVHIWKAVVTEFHESQAIHSRKITSAFLLQLSGVSWQGARWAEVLDPINKAQE